MGRAFYDSNNRPSVTGVSAADGATPVEIYADPLTHRILTSDQATDPATGAKQDAQSAILQQIESNTELLAQLAVVVKTLQQATVNPPYIDKSANAIRNQVQSGTVTTVTTVTNLTNFGTQAADVTYRINSLTAWANSVRRTIS